MANTETTRHGTTEAMNGPSGIFLVRLRGTVVRKQELSLAASYQATCRRASMRQKRPSSKAHLSGCICGRSSVALTSASSNSKSIGSMSVISVVALSGQLMLHVVPADRRHHAPFLTKFHNLAELQRV
jgi:hypothetical protein